METKLPHIVLVLLILIACSREDAHNSGVETRDMTKSAVTYRELEKAVREYYILVERDVSRDLGVSEDEISSRVQSLINDGYVKEPVIFVITENGPAWKTVDYLTYKQFMSDHAVASRRYHGVQPNIGDSLVSDSVRSELLKAFKADSLTLD